MKEVQKDEVLEISGGVLPSEPGGGLVIPGMPVPGGPIVGPGYPQVPCFPDIINSSIVRTK